jgi:hypothetical protein
MEFPVFSSILPETLVLRVNIEERVRSHSDTDPQSSLRCPAILILKVIAAMKLNFFHLMHSGSYQISSKTKIQNIFC